MIDLIHHTVRPVRMFTAAAAAVALLVTIQGQATAQMVPAGAKSLVAQAKKEGTINLAWGASTLGGKKGINRFKAGFNKFYGLNTNFKYTVGIHFAARPGS